MENFRFEMDGAGPLQHMAKVARERRAPGAGEVEVEIVSAGLNFREVLKALGVYPGMTAGAAPITFDGDVAGRVIAVGAGVEHLRVGDEVAGAGAAVLASHATLPAHLIARKPKSLSFDEAATIPIAFMTARYALHHAARIKPGERILIHAAAGGVGLAAVMLAREAGAEIYATAGRPEKRQYLESLGIQAVMDSRSLNFADEIMARTGGEGVDVVLNSLAGEFIPRSLSVLREFGRFLEIGRRDIYDDAALRLGPFRRNLSFHAIDLQPMRPAGLAALLAETLEPFHTGALGPLPFRRFGVDEVHDAFRMMRRSLHIGKIVIGISGNAGEGKHTPKPAAYRIADECPDAIAIVGMGCRLPGGDSPEAFWQSIENGLDLVTEVPEDRWSAGRFYDEDLMAPGRTVSRWGGFVRPEFFDAAFFGISKGEASGMDPQQRLLLEVAWEAIESAGIAAGKLAGTDTGVFLASAGSDYADLSMADPLKINAYSLTGNLNSFVANRLSWFLDLRGPSLVIDTACSSSLVAIHLACQSLRRNECGAAIAGGVNLTLLPNASIAMSKAWLLSGSGRCRSFDASGDGYVRGEGCGLIVLKRLSDALRDGDPVRAVIRGSALNQNGRGDGVSSITAPNPDALEAVVRRSLEDARLSPSDIDYVEAHGVGSPLTDGAEISALARVFGGARQQPVVLGSVKTNIGHLEAASGIASVIRVVLSLERRSVSRQLHLGEPNAALAAHAATFVTASGAARPWSGSTERRRRAGVNSFGIGGTNVHLVLEEAPDCDVVAESCEELPLLLSARTLEDLDTLAERYVRYLDSHPEASLRDICGTAWAGRTRFTVRRVVKARTTRELREKLAAREFAAEGGEAVDFGRFRRIPLPTYPFRQTRYWLRAEEPVNDLESRIRREPEENRRQALTAFVLQEVKGLLGSHGYDASRGFFELGMNSLMSVELVTRLQAAVGHSHRLPATLLFERPTPEALVDYLAQEVFSLEPKAEPRAAIAPGAAGEPIAIIGMACRLPGAANTEEFWDLLAHGREAISPVPADRWNIDEFYDADPAVPGKINVRSGGFLPRVDLFDAEFFGIMPREASAMDPQQRILLEVAHEALENAGAAGETLAGSRVGVFVGASGNDHLMLQLNGGAPSGIDAYTGTGNLNSAIAGRLSCLLGLRGPSLTVDTACSSSLVAVHLACQSLRSGESDMALAAGVNIMLSPEASIFLTKARALAPDGRCKAFDASADGYVRGEGCGVVALRRLSDAVASNDRILAVIRGSAANHDGRSSGLTVPNGQAQLEVIREAVERAGVAPGDVAYVEAHGTGTPLGDPIEARALTGALRGEHGATPLLVGSVKTNIGHLEASAGVAGLIKVVLSLGHGLIPAHLHFREMNPHIASEGLPIRVPAEAMEWPTGAKRRVAGLSSFGLTGTNTHVVIEEASETAPGLPDEGRCQILALSARTPEALRERVAALAAHMSKEPAGSLEELCFTSNTGRRHFAERAAFVAHSWDEMRARLSGETVLGDDSDERRRLVQIADDYRSGATISWEALYAGKNIRKIALPTYPFQRRRFWYREDLASPAEPEMLYEVQWRRRSDEPAIKGWAGQWLILCDSSGQGTALARELEARGAKCELAMPGCKFVATGRKVVHLWSLDATPLSQRTSCDSVIELVKQGSARLWIVTRGAVRTGSESGELAVAQRPIWGLGKVTGVEQPEMWGGLIDIDATAESLQALVRELAVEEPCEIALRAGVAYVAAVVRAETPRSAEAHLSAAATYLITGGLGGLGLEVAGYLVQQGARRLVLASRRPADEEARRRIQDLESRGAEVRVVSLDVSDVAAVHALVEQIPDLRGVIHAAGITDESVILHHNWQRFEGVMAPKAYGAWHLHQAAAGRALDFFVLFSSAVSLEGSTGHAGYTAANEFLDGLAEYRQQLGLPGLSINWPPWAGIGMQAELERKGLAWRAGKYGLGTIQPSAALALFGRLLSDRRARVAVLPNWKPASLAQTKQRDDVNHELLDRLSAAGSSSRRLLLLTRFVGEEVVRVCGLDASNLPPVDRSLLDAGMDSLMAVELRNALSAALGKTLPATAIFEYPTIEALSGYLLSEYLDAPLASVTESLHAPVTFTGEAAFEDQIRAASDEEAEALLLERLAALEVRV